MQDSMLSEVRRSHSSFAAGTINHPGTISSVSVPFADLAAYSMHDVQSGVVVVNFFQETIAYGILAIFFGL